MKKLFILIWVLLCSMVFGQEATKNKKIIDFYPSFRFGFQLPVHTGTNLFAKEYRATLGFHSTLSLVKFYNFKISLGYEFQKLNLENQNAVGKLDYINTNSYLYILEYEVPLNYQFVINPTASYGLSNLNYKEIEGHSSLAKQTMEEIRVGTFVDYRFDKTFSFYSGLHFAHMFNADLKASPENKNYFGKGNKCIFTVGILIH